MPVHVSARSDHAVRAMLLIAAESDGQRVKAATLAERQDVAVHHLQAILQDLRRAGLLTSRSGQDGGYALTRPAGQISVGDILRATNGVLSTVRGLPPNQADYHGVVAGLHDVWQALDTAVTHTLDRFALTDVLAGQRRPTR